MVQEMSDLARVRVGRTGRSALKTCIISYETNSQRPGSMHDTECLGYTEMTQRVDSTDEEGRGVE